MARKSTTIEIQNNSGVANRRYMFYLPNQELDSTSKLPLLPVLCFVTETSLSDGGTDSFTIGGGIFAVLCQCKGYRSEHMRDGCSIIRKYSLEVMLGEKGLNNGTSLKVEEHDRGSFRFSGTANNGTAPYDTFEISCPASLPEANNLAVGIGRKIGDSIVPVAVVRCVPGERYRFTPKHYVRVVIKPDASSETSAVDYVEGMVYNGPHADTTNLGLGQMDTAGNPVKFYEDSPGKFSVNAPPKTFSRAAWTSADDTKGYSSQSSASPQGAQAAGGHAGSSGGTSAQGSSSGNSNADNLNDIPFSTDRVREWDVVFVVDDTGSMQLPAKGSGPGPTRWKLVCDALEFLADEAAARSLDGADLHFLLNKRLARRCLKTKQEFTNQLQQNDVGRNYGGTFFEPTLNLILNRHVTRLRRYFNDLTPDAPRPLDVLVLTDGAAMDQKKTRDLLVRTANQIKDIGGSENQFGIQFVQVGEDAEANKWLQNLGAEVKTRSELDVIDTVPYTEQDSTNKDTFGKTIARILIGAMDPEERNSKR